MVYYVDFADIDLPGDAADALIDGREDAALLDDFWPRRRSRRVPTDRGPAKRSWHRPGMKPTRGRKRRSNE
jgi:hypothetical protein